MFTNLLFGVEHSPQRRLCIILALILTVLGAAIMVQQGLESGLLDGLAWGIPFVLLGLVAVAILSRSLAAHDAKIATSEQLTRLTGNYDDDALQQLVDHSHVDPNPQLERVSGQFDGVEIRAAVDKVRGESTETK